MTSVLPKHQKQGLHYSSIHPLGLTVIWPNEVNASDRPPKRCRMQHTQAERDRLILFLDKLHNPDEDECDEMSSFFVRISAYLAYFGRPTRAGVGSSTAHRQQRNPGERGVERSLSDASASTHPDNGLAREEQEQLVREGGE
jgi:hypothetical protein